MTGAGLRLVVVAALGGSVALLAARGCSETRPALSAKSISTALETKNSAFTLHAGPEARLTARTLDGLLERDLVMSLVVDGAAHPLVVDKGAVHYETEATSTGTIEAQSAPMLVAWAPAHVDVGGAALEVTLSLRTWRDADALVLSVAPVTERQVALRVDVPTEGRAAFVSGTGALGDLGTVTGPLVTLDAESAVIGLTSARGAVEVATGEGDEPEPGTPLHLFVTSPPSDAATPADLRIVVSPASQSVYRALFALAGEPASRVKGLVKGTGGHATVHGLDADGAPRVVFDAEPEGRFSVDVPRSVVQWYASLDVSRSSSPILYTPGTPWDLVLDVSPGGELAVRIVDADTKAPLTARLLVHGIDGTLDPSFGPDYRASGAGPLMDSLRGEVTTPLPAGRYRVAATKGLEWSIDATNVNIEPGRQTVIELAPRHVVPTPGVVGADLHVHARPSFDTPVSPEDRVLDLVAAGVEFAIPLEHNIVGDYGPALAALDLSHEFASVPGVEVTTYSPRFGHFGVFPYKGAVPPYRGTNPNAVFSAARRGDPARILQVNHPRLPMNIGYFNVFHFDPQLGKDPPPNIRMDFDTLEVFNGFDLGKIDRVESVMHDWFALLNHGYRYVATGDSDSHRIQYQWAGYPRTLIAAGEAASGEKGPLDPTAIIAALKAGHATVTNGPVVELDVQGSHPGDELVTKEDPVHAHVVVRAAPWVDVTSLEIVVGGKSLEAFPVPSRPTKIGPEPGTLTDAAARTIRFDKEVSLPLGPANAWIVAVARGTRKLDDVLPFMPTVPLGFTNPVWITREPRPVATRLHTPGPGAPRSSPPAGSKAGPNPPGR